MTEWQLTTTSEATQNQRSLQRLTRAIALSKGQFVLILVRCNYAELRQQMLTNLRSLTKDINLREIFLNPSTTALHNAIATELFLDHPVVITDSLPDAVMVFGLESVIELEDLLTGINQARDAYAATFGFPLVLWLKDEVATMLSRLAPDFKSWAATTIKFEMASSNLINLVQQETKYLFTKILDAGALVFLSNAALDLDPKSQHRREIESARYDLKRLYNLTLEPELEASLEFVLGRDHYADDEIDEALEHYQKSLVIWQHEQQDTETLLRTPYFLERQAVVLFHLGLCYRRLAELRPAVNKNHWQDALIWFKECLEVLEEAQRNDLVAKFILPICEMLQRLEAWKDLEQLAQKSLGLHETYANAAQMAQDYGFLAAVAIAESNWILANQEVSVLRKTIKL